MASETLAPEQAAPATATAPETVPAAPESAAAATPSAPETAAPQTPPVFDPSTLPPELQRKLSDYDALSQRAQSYDQLVRHPEFQKWYAGQTGQKPASPTAKSPLESYSDEQLASLGISRPQAEFIDKLAEERAKMFAEPRINEAKQEVAVMRRASEIESFAKEHSDFWELDKQNLIEPVLNKYPSISIQDAYILAKAPFLQQEAVNKAHGIVEKKKAASVERPGVSPSASAGKVKVKDRVEAMEIAMRYAREGKEAPDFEIGGK